MLLFLAHRDIMYISKSCAVCQSIRDCLHHL